MKMSPLFVALAAMTVALYAGAVDTHHPEGAAAAPPPEAQSGSMGGMMMGGSMQDMMQMNQQMMDAPTMEARQALMQKMMGEAGMGMPPAAKGKAAKPPRLSREHQALLRRIEALMRMNMMLMMDMSTMMHGRMGGDGQGMKQGQ